VQKLCGVIISFYFSHISFFWTTGAVKMNVPAEYVPFSLVHALVG